MSGNISMAFASNSDLDSALEFYNLSSAPLKFFQIIGGKTAKLSWTLGQQLWHTNDLVFKSCSIKNFYTYL